MIGRYAHQGPLAERRRGPSPMDALIRDRSNIGIRSSFRKSGDGRLVALHRGSA
jgi:hypothetical protein